MCTPSTFQQQCDPTLTTATQDVSDPSITYRHNLCFKFGYPDATSCTSDLIKTEFGSEFNNAITGLVPQVPSSGQTQTTETLFSILLYADDAAWDAFKAQISITTSTDVEYEDTYSSYAMFWYCSLEGTLNATKTQSGCCLRDREPGEGGGYCIIYNDTVPTSVKVDTYWLVEAEFVSAVENSQHVLPSNKIQADTTDTNLGFERFKCEIQVGTWMKCWKLQLWPSASYAGGYRFESGKRAEAYYYDYAQGTSNSALRWKQNRTFFLQGATALAAVASALTASLLTF